MFTEYYNPEQLKEVLSKVKGQGFIVCVRVDDEAYTFYQDSGQLTVYIDGVDALYKIKRILGDNYEQILDYVHNFGFVVYDPVEGIPHIL